jgi:hypothetical protein
MPDINSPPELRKPLDFWRANRRRLPFNTFSAFKYHLERRHRNGLVESGAVVESPLGNLINPARFDKWLLGETKAAA